MNPVQALLADPVTLSAGTVLLAFVFASAAFGKWRAPERFAGALSAYRLVPSMLLGTTVRVLPLVELAVVPLMLLERSRAWGFALAAGLLLLYGAAMAVNLLRGRHALDCGCGGAPQPIGWPLVGRNAVLAALALALGWAAAAGGGIRPLDAFDALGIAAASAGFVVAWLMAEELLRQAGRLAALRAADGHGAHD